MGHYKSNLRDIFFNLFEVLGRDEILGHGPYEDLDHDTAVAVLTEVEHLAATKLAESFADSDRSHRRSTRTAHAVARARGVQEVLPRVHGRRLLAARAARRARRPDRRRRRCSGR